MIAIYAMGGGLGHLRRAQAVAAQVAKGERTVVITASPHAPPEAMKVPRALEKSPKELAEWLRFSLRYIKPNAVVVDAFPLGICGELADATVLPHVPRYHIARLMRWETYRSRFAGDGPFYAATYAVEPLTPPHEEFLRSRCQRFESIDLPLPPSKTPAKDPLAALRVRGRELWLIVHSGSATEVQKLLGYARARAGARQANFVVVSPRKKLALPEDVARFDTMDAASLYPFAERVVTGCGFNSMREGAAYPEKHLFLPFARRFDDQALRALRRIRGAAE